MIKLPLCLTLKLQLCPFVSLSNHYYTTLHYTTTLHHGKNEGVGMVADSGRDAPISFRMVRFLRHLGSSTRRLL